MKIEGYNLEREDADQELEEALDALRALPQKSAALRVGISERRLRDIECGRSKPRSSTREAILRLAQEISMGQPSTGSQAFGQNSTSGDASFAEFQVQQRQDMPGYAIYTALIGLGIIVVWIIVAALRGPSAQEWQ